MRFPTRLLISSCLVAAVVSAAEGQTRATWSVQASGLYTGLNGGAYSGIGAGGGFEAQARYKIDPVWSLGGGWQGTSHSLTAINPSTNTPYAGSVSLQGLFLEPRRLVDIGSESIFPYVSARGAVLRQSLTSGTFQSSADGVTANIGAGVMIPFGNTGGDYPTLLELGVSAGYTWFGDFSTVDTRNPGRGTTGTTGSGSNYVLRVGIAMGLPFGTSKPGAQ